MHDHAVFDDDPVADRDGFDGTADPAPDLTAAGVDEHRRAVVSHDPSRFTGRVHLGEKRPPPVRPSQRRKAFGVLFCGAGVDGIRHVASLVCTSTS